MIIRVVQPITAPGYERQAGLYESSQAEFERLAGIGSVRPATADEIEQASQVESAQASPASETATLRNGRRNRAKAE